ncbi:YkgJ family cysteine cluster protein [Methanosarcina siciliae]|uniref:YkgJ family cysteine cluster protein n=1 Tax=Methanosarcina siciliae TaxID=38027 RepID=UPI001E4888B3|nr:YkgJ family cysteine cluster protein [Methanosarcina siciliae]
MPASPSDTLFLPAIATCVSLIYLQDRNLYMEESSSDSQQKSGKTKYQLILIASLKKEIEMARRLDPEKLAHELEKTGFSCQYCGKCCRRAFGDNRVVLTPPEIEKIQKHTGLSKLEIAGPLIPETCQPEETGNKEEDRDREIDREISFVQPEISKTDEEPFSETSPLFELLKEDIDSEGNIHAYGWMLRQKRNGDCIFLEKETNRCRIYPVRPMLCSTYPFYIEGLKLYTCECEGLGGHISTEESRKLAEALLSRYIAELEDTLAMYEKYEDFEKGKEGLEIARNNLEKGTCVYVVHDSKGVTKIIN